DVDHRASTLRAHRLKACAPHPEPRRQVRFQELAEDAFRRDLDRPFEDDAGGRHEDVKAATTELECPLDRLLGAGNVESVAFDHRHALLAQAPYTRAPALRCPGRDQRAPALQPQPAGHRRPASRAAALARSEARMPPSTSRIEPLQNPPSAEAKKAT